MNITGTLKGIWGGSGAFSKSSTNKMGSGDYDTWNASFNAANSWTGNTSEEGAHTHTVTINNGGSHTHAVTYSNSAIGSSSKIQTDGIKVRVYTRYK